MKKILITLTAVAGIFVAANNSSAQTFKDVSSSASYYDAVELLADLGAISTNTGKFNPGGTVTRGQAAKILAVTLKLDTNNVTDPGFKDVPKSSGFYAYVAALQNEGVINGKTTTNFGVNDPLTRGQMAKILVKGFGLPEFELDDIFENEPAVAIGKETRKYVSPLYFYGITTGQGEGKYGAANPLKRSQLALFVERTYSDFDDIKHDRYIELQADEYQYPESTEYEVADIVAIGHDGGILLRPFKTGQTAIYYGEKSMLVSVKKDLSMSYEADVEIPDAIKGVVSDYRYYDFEVSSAASYDSNGNMLEDLTPSDDLSSLSFLSRDTSGYTRMEVILDNGDIYEYFINAKLDGQKRYYVTQLYEVGTYISFYYLYNFDGDLQVEVPTNSGLTYTTDGEYITFRATKAGKFEVQFGMDQRGIEVIDVNGRLAIREYDIEQ